jgi:hypothetical protein
MVFNIAQFSSQVAKHGLAKNNLFFTRITLPASLSDLEQQMPTRELSFLCKSATLPSLDLDVIDIRSQGFGKAEKRPTEIRAGSLTLQFMVDSNFAVMKYFHRWMQSITNYNSYDGHFVKDAYDKYPYEFEYKENYAAQVEILVYSGNDADKVYLYKLGNVYPFNIGQVDVSWENQAEVMVLPIGFEYDKIKVDGMSLGQVTDDYSRTNGFLTYLSSINSYAQAINQIERPRNIQDLINTVTTVNTIYNTL